MINIGGVIAISIFYLAIFLIGIWAAWKRRKQDKNSEDRMLAGRSIGYFVGLLTLTATWVGGGYINGSAEAMYGSGLIWCQAPFGYSVSLVLGGLFFARKMRDAGYVTMLDPFQDLYGKRWGSFLFFPALGGEMLWSAAILSALGSTLAVMINLDGNISIMVSAAIAVSYTLFGGLAAVAYTDVVQLFCIFIGLWLAIPFAMTHEAVDMSAMETKDWIGEIEPGSPEWGEWIDYYVLLMLGGIPWQAYFQRVLSAKSSRHAQVLSVGAALGCIVMVIPACMVGIIAKYTDWESTSFNRTIEGQHSLVLPLVIYHLTPTWVSYLGLGAVSAAVMSSADSSILSSSSMFARNLYTNVFRQYASDFEQTIVLRLAVIVIACLACTIAINVKSVYTLFYLCGDIVYVMLFPQLLMAIHAPKYVNIFGSCFGYFTGLALRLLGGEKVLRIPAVIKYPWYNEETGIQYFPFRTFSMLVTLVSMIVVSWLGKKVFGEEFLLKITDKPVDKSTKFGIDNPDIIRKPTTGKDRQDFEKPTIQLSSYKRSKDYLSH